MLIKVTLEETGRGRNPILAAQHAARECYSAKNASLKDGFTSEMDVQSALWSSGHHTTFEHADHYFTFQIEGLAISEVTFGLHLAGSFYNSSQRSGRYCGTMFRKPDIFGMVNYVKELWPEVSYESLRKIEDYVTFGFRVYNEHLADAEKNVIEAISSERPHVSEKIVEKNGEKFAQEQMRMFIPTIFPTGLVFTVNLPTLSALYHEAWTPGAEKAIELMVEELLKVYPELSFMFPPKNPETKKQTRAMCEKWTEKLFGEKFSLPVEVKTYPELVLKDVVGELVIPENGMESPLNRMPFSPLMMNNNLFEVRTQATMSVATMGQDQRHRTVKRGFPEMMNAFYLPPIAQKLSLADKAVELFNMWRALGETVPKSLLIALAPYGAMVTYEKVADGHAFLHEVAKRACWCAQEEIYHLACQLRKSLAESGKFSDEALKAISPKCVFSGRCGEGERYCGRDLKAEDKFPQRQV